MDKNLLDSSKFNVLALIDPDQKNDNILDELIQSINANNFSGILVGGSSIADNQFHNRIKKIKDKSTKPIIIFPGSSEQISQHADAILFTSLLSGRNPKYLIEEQVKGAKLIKQYSLPVISAGYILVGTSLNTSVVSVSQTEPIDPNDYENILNHSLVAQYFGMKYIYLEHGSGANNPIDSNLVKFLKTNINIPIIVGGGITKKDEIIDLQSAGADFVVISTILEQNPNFDFINAILP